ncbi:unnamed protein product [Menidia menidia]|uniref:(Atlantic silverside) hypothetical protein n=1 Tax=Menidia menidia TaxID=238744 RepID=A0A8S4BAT7_9TELE|nr:unnamed protein product [Menidia menidia]
MSSENNGGDEEDGLFLERVLDKLYDFGSAPKKKQKKKKRKRCEEVEEEEEEELPVVKDSLEPQSQQAPLSTQQTGPAEHLVNRVEIVTFQDPRKKPKRTKQTPGPVTVPAPQITDQKQDHQKTELSLEKARLEVHRFGITGYKKEEQRVFEQDRAVMLGARPPKKEYVNYKQLQQRIREKKQKAKEDVQPDKKKKKKKQSNQRDKKSASGSAVAPSGQVGRFKNGLLVLSPKEIQKIKARR